MESGDETCRIHIDWAPRMGKCDCFVGRGSFLLREEGCVVSAFLFLRSLACLLLLSFGMQMPTCCMHDEGTTNRGSTPGTPYTPPVTCSARKGNRTQDTQQGWAPSSTAGRERWHLTGSRLKRGWWWVCRTDTHTTHTHLHTSTRNARKPHVRTPFRCRVVDRQRYREGCGGPLSDVTKAAGRE